VLGAQFNIQQFDFSVQVAALDLKIVGRAGDVPVVLPKLSADIVAFKRVPRVPKRLILFNG
jgi:hypothetical protein